MQSQTKRCLNYLAYYSFLREKENEHFVRYNNGFEVQEKKDLAGIHMKQKECQHQYLMQKVFLEDTASTTSSFKLQAGEQEVMQRTDKQMISIQ